MQKKWLPLLFPHLIAVVVFLLIAVVYCKPVFEHKVLQQADVTQYKAMARNSFAYKEKHGTFPLWTQGMFSGMPAYQLAIDVQSFAPYGFFHDLLTLWLPKLPGFFFLACICFYFLSQVLRVNPYIGIIGALAFAYATYNPTALVAGHDTKMTALALLPAFIAGILLIFEKRYIAGLALTALFTDLFVAANHPQIVYYGMIIAGFMSLAYIIRWIRQKEFRHLLISGALALAGIVIGVMGNAVATLTTIDYSPASIRGGSELATTGGTVTNKGLSEDYAFSYSTYKTESFELLVPKIYGGGNNRTEFNEGNLRSINALQSMPPQLGQQLQNLLHLYWGDISADTGGPAYAGAIVCLLAFIGLFILDGKHKWWILAACILSFMMSWGSNLEGFNSLLLRALPGYNKFRAPSVILVIPNFLFCVLAILCLQRLLTLTATDRETFRKKYRKALYFTGGVFVLLFILYLSFDYTTTADRNVLQRATGLQPQITEYIKGFLSALREDRQAIFLSSLLRSLLFTVAAAVLLTLVVKGKLKPLPAIGIVGALAFIDLMGMNVQYLSYENFQDEDEALSEFTPSSSDQAVLRDKSWYRVLDLRQGGLNSLTYGAMTAYWHHSIGGYHPAKLSIYNDLIENQLARYPDCMPVINMLNTKYIFEPTRDGHDSVSVNPGALGPAWLVRSVKYAGSPRAAMDALTNLDPKDTAVLFGNDRVTLGVATPTDTISLTKADNDEMIYESNTGAQRFAVFSEIFYNRGWRAYIDNQETPIIRTNYALRGLSLPRGHHTIRFEFHPSSYYSGMTLQLISGIILLLLLLTAAIFQWRKIYYR
ncbi:MAG: YfhO family protein [Bacteroidetes bacterium]|nr:YfhO family protein [Bacteroidota bacterium]